MICVVKIFFFKYTSKSLLVLKIEKIPNLELLKDDYFSVLFAKSLFLLLLKNLQRFMTGAIAVHLVASILFHGSKC